MWEWDCWQFYKFRFSYSNRLNLLCWEKCLDLFIHLYIILLHLRQRQTQTWRKDIFRQNRRPLSHIGDVHLSHFTVSFGCLIKLNTDLNVKSNMSLRKFFSKLKWVWLHIPFTKVLTEVSLHSWWKSLWHGKIIRQTFTSEKSLPLERMNNIILWIQKKTLKLLSSWKALIRSDSCRWSWHPFTRNSSYASFWKTIHNKINWMICFSSKLLE